MLKLYLYLRIKIEWYLHIFHYLLEHNVCGGFFSGDCILFDTGEFDGLAELL